MLCGPGCVATSKEAVLSCTFADGPHLCGWTNKPGGASSWVTSNTSTPEPDTGPLWGHPKGSFYAYTNTSSATPNEEGTFDQHRPIL